MTAHFVYRLSFPQPDGSNKYYVGKHSGRLNDFETGRYKTSSKIVSKLINEGKPFTCKIVRTFDTSQEALNFEVKYHSKIDAKNHPLFLNLSNQTSSKFNFINDKIYVRDKLSGELLSFSPEEYSKIDKEKFVHHAKGFVSVINEKGERLKIKSAEYQRNKEKYTTGTSNKVNVVDELGNTFKVSKEEYWNNKEKYTFVHKNKLTCRNKNTGVYKTFYKNEIDETEWEFMFSGKRVVKDKNTGKIYQINANDFNPDIHESPSKGKFLFQNNKTGEIKMLEVNKVHKGWTRYSLKGKKKMVNILSGETKMVNPNEVDRNVWRFKNEIR